MPNKHQSLLPVRSRDLDAAASTQIIDAPAATVDEYTDLTPESVSLFSLVIPTFRRWWLAITLSTLVLMLLTTALFLVFWEPQYQAAVVIQLKSEAPFVVHDDHIRYRPRDSKFEQTQLDLIRHPDSLRRVLDDPEFQRYREVRREDDPVEWLGDQLQFRGRDDSELHEISLETPDPLHSQRLLQSVMTVYFQRHKDEETAQDKAVVALLEEEMANRQVDLKAQNDELLNYLRELTVNQPEANRVHLEYQENRKSLAATEMQLAKAVVDRQVLEDQLETELAAVESGTLEAPEFYVKEAIDAEPDVLILKQQIAEQRMRVKQIQNISHHGERSPAVRRGLDDLASLEEMLIDLKIELAQYMREDVNERYRNERQMMLQQLQIQVQQLRVQERELEKQRTVMEGKVDDLAQQVAERPIELTETEQQRIELYNREIAREQEAFENVARRALAVKTEMRAPDRVVVPNVQQPEHRNDEVRFYSALSAGLLVSLLLPLALAVMWERQVGRLGDSRDLRVVGIPMIAEVARLPLNRSSESKKLAHEMAQFEESIDSLRNCIFLAPDMEELQAVTITSAVAGEGKTTVAAQLAVSVARATGEPTLLIDADVRSPDLHTVFEVDGSQGLAQVLQGETSPEKTIVGTSRPNLFVLPAGRLTTNPHRLFDRNVVEKLITELRSEYRYVIIDTPPMLAASEALVAAKASDATLLVALRDISVREQVSACYDRLINTGIYSLGVALNGVPARSYVRSYGKYSVTTTD